MPPRVARMVLPQYPEIARKAGVEGFVIRRIVVDEQGNVVEAEAVSGQPPGIFEEAAVKAVLQWKYQPTLQRDRPVRVQVGQRLDFRLKDIKPRETRWGATVRSPGRIRNGTRNRAGAACGTSVPRVD